jgi:hypothetical protein
MARKSFYGDSNFGQSTYQSQVDAGWGLIFRINYLWSRADQAALDGDLDKWNFVLDRVFCNLCYRNQIEIELDANEKIKNISLSEKDDAIFKKFTDDIKRIKIEKNTALKRKDKNLYDECSNKQYKILMLKDIWLRKFMNELGLYLKEVEKNPSRALFGGG